MSIGSLFWSFQGRIGRAQFWLGFVIVIVMGVAFGALIGAIEGFSGSGDPRELGPLAATVMFVGIVALTVAQLAVYVKRFHDRGKSGWWVLIAFVPLIGIIWIIVDLGILPGEPGPNAYGPPVTSAIV